MSLLKKIPKVNLKKTKCPECGAEQAMVRKPKNLRQVLWGGNTCPECACEMDRFGKKLVQK